MQNRTRNLNLPRAPKPNRHSRDLEHATLSYDMDAVEFLHHKNPPTWAGVEPANSGVQGQRQTVYGPQPVNLCKCMNNSIFSKFINCTKVEKLN
ncbi:hypothetical protein TNCV_5092141 [Trichonephila clavipes]|nr:hypothetical protein TNCV_5092141 [Trichonephila clavipes]